jgi:hypothetical protein
VLGKRRSNAPWQVLTIEGGSNTKVVLLLSGAQIKQAVSVINRGIASLLNTSRAPDIMQVSPHLSRACDDHTVTVLPHTSLVVVHCGAEGCPAIAQMGDLEMVVESSRPKATATGMGGTPNTARSFLAADVKRNLHLERSSSPAGGAFSELLLELPSLFSGLLLELPSLVSGTAIDSSLQWPFNMLHSVASGRLLARLPGVNDGAQKALLVPYVPGHQPVGVRRARLGPCVQGHCTSLSSTYVHPACMRLVCTSLSIRAGRLVSS